MPEWWELERRKSMVGSSLEKSAFLPHAWTYRRGLMVFRSVEQVISLVDAGSCIFFFVNPSWFLLIPNRQIGVHWKMHSRVPPYFQWHGRELFFFVLLVIRHPFLMIEEQTSLVLEWKLHLQCLRDVILQPWLLMVSWDIVSSLPLIFFIDTRMYDML